MSVAFFSVALYDTTAPARLLSDVFLSVKLPSPSTSLNVAAFIASENVASTLDSFTTLSAPSDGATLVTVGAVTSGVTLTVKSANWY